MVILPAYMRRGDCRPLVERHRIADHQHTRWSARAARQRSWWSPQRWWRPWPDSAWPRWWCCRRRLWSGRRSSARPPSSRRTDRARRLPARCCGCGTTTQNTRNGQRDAATKATTPCRPRAQVALKRTGSSTSYLRDRRSSKRNSDPQRRSAAIPTFPCAAPTAARRSGQCHRYRLYDSTPVTRRGAQPIHLDVTLRLDGPRIRRRATPRAVNGRTARRGTARSTTDR